MQQILWLTDTDTVSDSVWLAFQMPCNHWTIWVYYVGLLIMSYFNLTTNAVLFLFVFLFFHFILYNYNVWGYCIVCVCVKGSWKRVCVWGEVGIMILTEWKQWKLNPVMLFLCFNNNINSTIVLITLITQWLIIISRILVLPPVS